MKYKKQTWPREKLQNMMIKQINKIFAEQIYQISEQIKHMLKAYVSTTQTLLEEALEITTNISNSS